MSEKGMAMKTADNIDENGENLQENFESDFYLKLEMQHRAFVMELKTKRDQINRLRNELETANYNLNESNRTLTSIQKSKDELEFHLGVSMKNGQHREDEHITIKQNLVKALMNTESLTSENRALKELLQNSERENVAKTNRLADLETEQYCHRIYQKDIVERSNKLRSHVDKCKESLNKLQENQRLITNANEMESIETSKRLTETIDFYKRQMAVLSAENVRLENEAIRTLSALKTYERYVSEAPLNFTNRSYRPIYEQLIELRTEHDEELRTRDSAIDALQVALAREKETSGRLWERVKKLEAKVAERTATTVDEGSVDGEKKGMKCGSNDGGNQSVNDGRNEVDGGKQ